MNIIKTKLIGLTALATISVFSAAAQQNRTVGDFTGIKAGDAFNVVISQSDANTVKVDAPDNVQSQIKTEVKDGILSITGEGNIKTDKPIDINIGIKTLTSLEVSGSADVKSENQLTCDKL